MIRGILAALALAACVSMAVACDVVQDYYHK
jgi:hypothetical protein